MRRLIVLLAIFQMVACSSSKSDHRGDADAEEEGTITESGAYADPTDQTIRPDGSTNLALVKKAPSGAKMRLLSASALNRLYKRVFDVRPNGDYGAACSIFSTLDCQANFFTNAELKDLKSMNLTRLVANFTEPDSFTLNYLRSLRAMLSRECLVLVNKEWGVAKNEGDTKRHLLIKNPGVPTSETLDNFMRTILGINDLQVEINTGSQEYRKAFEEALKSIPDEEVIPDALYKDLYRSTCIAIGMDPKVIVY
jgi:hypothetical protein